jgi:hypothetical protein
MQYWERPQQSDDDVPPEQVQLPSSLQYQSSTPPVFAKVKGAAG